MGRRAVWSLLGGTEREKELEEVFPDRYPLPELRDELHPVLPSAYCRRRQLQAVATAQRAQRGRQKSVDPRLSAR